VLFVATLLFATQVTTAQILYSENFDNLNLGNVGADLTGNTPGQGGWYTLSQSSEIPSENSNNYFKIVTEPGRGKVLELAATPGKGQTFLQKRGIDALWNSRNQSNNILKIEIDFYTGDQFSDGGTGLPIQGAIIALKPNDVFDATSNDVVGNFGFYPDQEIFTLHSANKTCSSPTAIVSQDLKLKNWIKIILYLDYTNLKYHMVIPSHNLIKICNLDPNIKLSSILLKNSNWIGSQAIVPAYKYDNLVISAVNTVPLKTKDFISEKFNLYPNPSKNVVNITNTENIAVEKITVYDVNGKLIKTKIYTNESTIQLDVAAFAAGTYLLHIETTEGTAIKKIIKE